MKISTFFEKQSKAEQAVTSVNQQPVSAVQQNEMGASGQSIRLPKLQLKKFSGDPKLWQEWWDSFEATVHVNVRISDVEFKFTHLRSLLEEAAHSAIAGLQLTSTNNTVAIDLLRERFAQKQTIINSHMDALLKVQGVSSISEMKKLRQVYNRVEIHIRGLQAYGITSDQYGALLVPILLSKIPEELRLIISRQFEGGSWDLDHIMEAFKKELEARERCVGANIGNNSGIRPTAPTKGNQPSASALFSSDSKITCTYCKLPHPLAECNVVTDVKERKALLRKYGRCYLCLKRGHVAKFCENSSIKCAFCSASGLHHSSLCSQTGKNSNGNGDQKARDATGVKSTTTSFVDSNTSVFLQTAQVLVSNPGNPEHKINTRLIFDTGSQRSYVSEGLREELACPTVKTETLMIKTFGTTTGELKSHDMVEVCIQGLNSEEIIEVHAYAVNTVCAPLENQAVQFAAENYPHLRDLPMADSCGNSELSDRPVNILIGADHYWSFFTGGMSRGRVDLLPWRPVLAGYSQAQFQMHQALNRHRSTSQHYMLTQKNVQVYLTEHLNGGNWRKN